MPSGDEESTVAAFGRRMHCLTAQERPSGRAGTGWQMAVGAFKTIYADPLAALQLRPRPAEASQEEGLAADLLATRIERLEAQVAQLQNIVRRLSNRPDLSSAI